MQTQYYSYGCSINTTDFPVEKVHVDELSSARIWQDKVCATLFAKVNINCRLLMIVYRIWTVRHIRIKNNSWSQNVLWDLTWVGKIFVNVIIR